jgi:hypothetical protein
MLFVDVLRKLTVMCYDLLLLPTYLPEQFSI